MTHIQRWALIAAAGNSRRMGQDKLSLLIKGKSVLQRSIECFIHHPAFEGMILVHNGTAPNLGYPQLHCCKGGATRAQSVMNGLTYLRQLTSYNPQVWVHDAARPCLTQAALDQLILAYDADDTPAITATPASDSIKRTSDNGSITHARIAEHCDRSYYWLAQTPQIALLDQLHQAYNLCLSQGMEVTDEATALGAAGLDIRLLACPAPNPKITFPPDVDFACSLIDT